MAAEDGAEQEAWRHVRLLDGVEVPCLELGPGPGEGERPLLVFGHGLTDRKEDDVPTLQSMLDMLAGRSPPASASSVPRAVVYDARGHGASRGWELGGPEQFHWRSLAADMLQVASARAAPGAAPGCLLGGISMGAGSALWAALLCPRLAMLARGLTSGRGAPRRAARCRRSAASCCSPAPLAGSFARGGAPSSWRTRRRRGGRIPPGASCCWGPRAPTCRPRRSCGPSARLR
mmetsp:Transcript_115846/g.338798  ORF Transcript_115846/g.338798 Transcript_115846/m.338798 type:complete len:233 (+) Transcript_115846:78-776(+)